MKYTTFTLLLFLMMISCFLACSNEEEVQPIFECQEDAYFLDSIQTQDALMGTWSWSAAICVSRKEEVVNTDRHSTLSIKFNSDTTLLIIDDDSVLYDSTFILRRVFEDRFTIETQPNFEQISGLITFCDDIVSFNDGYRDLCTNTFSKIN